MDITARHTKVVETIETQYGVLVREDYYGYPQSESNIYMVDFHGALLWFSERAVEGDSYANPVRLSSEHSVKCASWKGLDCEIDLKNGRLLHAAFTK
jgi:hypothetical protein